jgi:hypothetical protein
MGSEAAIIWNVVLSAFGLGYFIYGKKQKRILPLVCGIILMVFPYFVSGAIALGLIGAVLVAAPWVIKY